jgi:glycosyltransferase involved in cell wall biosynthesis
MLPQSETAHSLHLARTLIALGHRVRVLSGPGAFVQEFERHDIPCEVLRFSAVPGLGFLSAVRRALGSAQSPPDLLHVQSSVYAAAGARFAQAAGLPYFVTAPSLFGKRETLRVHPTLIRGIVAGSQEIREQLQNRLKIPRNLIRVITAGVDLEYFKTPDEPEATGNDRIPVVGMVGRFDPHKGGDLFIRAASMLLGQGKNCHFLIAGDGPQNQAWRTLVQELGVQGHVTFTSADRDFRMLMNAIDIFVRPSLREGTGLGLLEAMASGKPVVATGVGGVFHVVEENQTGFLVPKGDVPRLAVSILRLVDDRALALRMGRAGRRVVEERFNIADKARDLATFYQEKLEEAG